MSNKETVDLERDVFHLLGERIRTEASTLPSRCFPELVAVIAPHFRLPYRCVESRLAAMLHDGQLAYNSDCKIVLESC
mgnify:CR=1 FL=1